MLAGLQNYKYVRELVTIGSREFIHSLSKRLKKKLQQLKNLGINYLGVFNWLPYGSERKNKTRK